MGARFRLKAVVSATAGFGAEARVVITAMKKYGLVLADNGSPWYFQGEQNANWPDQLIEDLKRIPASAFVAVDTSSLMVDPDSAQVRLPDRRFRLHPLVSVWFRCSQLTSGEIRAVAQLGSALDWGSRGRRFKSCQPDHCDVSRHRQQPDLQTGVRLLFISGWGLWVLRWAGSRCSG